MRSEEPDGPGRQGGGGGAGAGGSRELVLGLVLGIVFGFLLQKGGVAKYELLMGALLLEDATVAIVMLSAIAVGMVGIFTMHAWGLVKLHEKPTRYGANVVGGLLFGAGFAIFGYCPGTAAAALGQGNLDVLFGLLGMVAGSYVYAEMSDFLGRTVEAWGNRGLLNLPALVGVPRKPLAVVTALALAALAVWLHGIAQ